MAARRDERGAVLFGEVVQGKQRADREFRAGPGKMGPVGLIAVQHLGWFAPTDDHGLRGIQPIRAAIGQKIMIRKRFERRVEEDLNKRF